MRSLQLYHEGRVEFTHRQMIARRPLDCLMDPVAFSFSCWLVNFIVSAAVGRSVGGNGQKSEHLTW